MIAGLLAAIAAFFGDLFGATPAALAASREGNSGQGGPIDDWSRFDALFQLYGRINGVPWTWLKAVALNESDLGRDRSVAIGLREPGNVAASVSSDGKSWGLMQVTIPTANDFRKGTTSADLNNPDLSVNIAAQYLGYLMKRYAGDSRKVIMSYNQGQGNTDKGKTYAAGYYEKWLKNLKRVEAKL